MTDWNVDESNLNALQQALNTDDRIGDHDVLVSEPISVGAWDDGRDRVKVKFQMLTADNNITDATFSAPTDDGGLAALKGSNRGMWFAAVNNKVMIGQLKKHYDVTPLQIREGMKFRVKTRGSVDKNTGKTYVKVCAFLSKEGIGKSMQSTTPTTPF